MNNEDHSDWLNLCGLFYEIISIGAVPWGFAQRGKFELNCDSRTTFRRAKLEMCIKEISKFPSDTLLQREISFHVLSGDDDASGANSFLAVMPQPAPFGDNEEEIVCFLHGLAR
jgi:hypothetical protein